jgi:hypothetical protein
MIKTKKMYAGSKSIENPSVDAIRLDRDKLRRVVSIALIELNREGYSITRHQWETLVHECIVPPATRAGISNGELRYLKEVIKIRDSIRGRFTIARLRKELKGRGLLLSN